MLAVLIFGIASSIIGYRQGYHKALASIEVKSDTVEVIRTIREPVPPPSQVRIVDYIFVPVKDTVWRKDTMLMPIPRSEKTYRTQSYTAVVSGFMPSLDYIETYQLTQTVTKVVRDPRTPIGVSVALGPSVIWSPFMRKLDAGVGITLGVTYTF